MTNAEATRKIPRQIFSLSPTILHSFNLPSVVETFFEMQDAEIADPPYDDFDLIVPNYWSLGYDTEQDYLNFIAANRNDLSTYGRKYGWEDRPANADYTGGHTFFRFTAKSLAGRAVTAELGRKTMWLAVGMTNRAGKSFFPYGEYYWPVADVSIFQLRKDGEGDELKELEAHGLFQGANLFMLLVVTLASKGITKTVKANKLAKLGIGKKKTEYSCTTYIDVDTSLIGGAIGAGIPMRPHLRRGHVRRQPYGANNSLTRTIFIQPTWVNLEHGAPVPRDHYNISRSTGLTT